MFFLNCQNGVSYNLVTQTPQYAIQSLQDLQNIPITASGVHRPEILADVASHLTARSEMAVVTHYNIRRTRRYLRQRAGSRSRRRRRATSTASSTPTANRLPRGNFIRMRGQLETMRSSYHRSARRPASSPSCSSTCSSSSTSSPGSIRSSSSPRFPRRSPESFFSSSSRAPRSAFRR